MSLDRDAPCALEPPPALEAPGGRPAAPPGAASRQAEFLAAYPDYAATAALDELRASELERLDRLGHVYLDYTGGGLYAASQVARHHDMLLAGRARQPALHNPTSRAATELVERGSRGVLRFFNASPDEYDVVFTANASGALKLVGESYPFEPRRARTC